MMSVKNHSCLPFEDALFFVLVPVYTETGLHPGADLHMAGHWMIQRRTLACGKEYPNGETPGTGPTCSGHREHTSGVLRQYPPGKRRSRTTVHASMTECDQGLWAGKLRGERDRFPGATELRTHRHDAEQPGVTRSAARDGHRIDARVHEDFVGDH